MERDIDEFARLRGWLGLLSGCSMAYMVPFGMFLAIIFVAVIVPIFSDSAQAVWDNFRLVNFGRITNGVVVEQRTTLEGDVGSNFSPSLQERYFTTYHYGVAGRDYQREQEIERDNYFAHREGDTIKVKYLPDEPSVSKIDGTDGLDVQSDRLLVASMMSLGVWWLGYIALNVTRERLFDDD